MGGIGPAVFLTRDVLEHVLPAVLAVLLFAPFVNPGGPPLALETLLGGVVVLSYALSAVAMHAAESPAVEWLKALLRRALGWDGSLRDKKSDPAQVRGMDEGLGHAEIDLAYLRQRKGWHAANWDYPQLFYGLGKEEREYLYLTRAYLRLFQLSSFYFLLFALLNLLWLVGLGIVRVYYLGEPWRVLLDIESPALGGSSAPTWAVIGLSLPATWALDQWYLGEYGSLFSGTGSHCELARRRHQEIGGLARSVWGRILPPVGTNAARVRLLADGRGVATSEVDPKEGWFQFEDAFGACLGKVTELRVENAAGEKLGGTVMVMAAKSVPEFVIRLGP